MTALLCPPPGMTRGHFDPSNTDKFPMRCKANSYTLSMETILQNASLGMLIWIKCLAAHPPYSSPLK